ncbi:MAG: sodium:solute symporter [Bacteroidaceae bacterium]|nr:sodium:solute symporter [Bacteroidaceae bacterium]
MLILLTLVTYIGILFLVSRLAPRGTDNASFFRGQRRSPWYLVAFGMVGASISGVSFVSVPGMVGTTQMTYLQCCMGFIAGYFLVAFVLLPVYYRLNLTSIYAYLGQRIGPRAHRTASAFFILSKTAASALKFYVVCLLLQRFVLDAYGVPFIVTVAVLVAVIWLYTRRGGIRTLVWTDTFQTLCMLVALGLIVVQVVTALGLTPGEALQAVADDSRSRIFVFDDWLSTQHFWKQFVSGAFIVVVMTGLDQDMMQKNLTCRTLRDAQKDMCSYGFAFVPVNLLLLTLGVLLSQLAAQQGTALPSSGDELLPMFAATGRLGDIVVVCFTIGVMASSFSSADSALTALTTTLTVDLLRKEDDTRTRQRVHLLLAVVFAVFILLVHALNSRSLIDAIYTIVGYTYGPLLGMFAFGLFTRRTTRDSAVPLIAIASPLLCFAISILSEQLCHYRFGYELLLLNGMLTFAGLWCLTKKERLPHSHEQERRRN